MIWVEFAVSSALLLLAATQLAKYGDVIAQRTGLGGMFVGTLLLAGATSLPELLTTINSLGQQAPNLAAGNLFGSCMFNMLLLAILDVTHWRARILRRVALKHALTAGLAILLIGMSVFFILADVDLRIGWVGLDSLLLIAVYVVGARLLQSDAPPVVAEEVPEVEGMPSLRRGIVGFVLASLVLVAATPFLVRSSIGIATITGLGTGFVGTSLLGMVTSLPEMVTMFAAVRLGAYDLAVGNLFGSNLFNMFALGFTDLFYTRGRFLGDIDPAFALVGLAGLLLTSLGLVNNLTRSERRVLFVEIDAIVLILGYFATLYLLYLRGVGA
ncbi:MAG: sodium:calcium antiporter [Anaerolineae bacterium]